jgi:hypothetical protein
MTPGAAADLAAQASQKVHGWIGEARANRRRSYRRARQWLTALAVCTRVAKLREYANKITPEDIEWLAADPQIGEAIRDMQALGRELFLLAAALTEQVSAKGMNGHEQRSTAA